MDKSFLLNSFDYENVLLNDSLFKKQFEEAVEYCLGISDDGLLYGFRKRDGMKAPGRTLAGWYGKQGFIFGQILGSLAKMYHVTGNEKLKDKLYYLTDEWAKTIDEDGYGLFPEKEKCVSFAVAYEYEKFVGGLLDAYEYAGLDRALEYLGRITDWSIIHFVPNESHDFLAEWYTLPENLYRAYEITGDEKYKTFGEKWEYIDFWERFLQDRFSVDTPKHAYSHVNSLNSAARAYKLSKDKKYLTYLEAAYKELTGKHIYATGGYGPQEDMFGKEGYLGDSIKSPWDRTLTDSLIRTRYDPQGNCEVSCCSWAVFKLCNYLLKFTGNALYGDWVEKMLYNCTLAQPPITPEGDVMYYASYYLDGAFKTTYDRRYHFAPNTYDALSIGFHQTWPCCAGTFPQDVTEYHNLAYYYDYGAVYISQYMPSRLELDRSGKRIIIECKTEYPQQEKVDFTINTPDAVEMSIKFRIPSWVRRKVTAAVNGVKYDIDANANEWGCIKRIWKNNDSLTIEFPMELYFRPIDLKNPDIAALCYGPVVLVTDRTTMFEGDMGHPENWIFPVPGKPLTFVTQEGCVQGYDFLTRTFHPFYKVGEMQWYSMYFRIRPKFQSGGSNRKGNRGMQSDWA